MLQPISMAASIRGDYGLGRIQAEAKWEIAANSAGNNRIQLIRIVAFPKIDWLMRQYREAYERFLCPICEYPIRTGPRKFLYWTRRTVNRILPPGDLTGTDEPYTCPSCGTLTFEVCPSCQKIRHSFLPHCEHCGAKKEVK
jgi:predicted RNA-binding Zn-ribbon protein involved in translation (DUF1610 family)